MRVFVDTSYYVARVQPRDQWRAAAGKAVKPDMTFFTSSMVINETVSLLQSRGDLSTALAFLEQVRGNDEVQIIHPDATLQGEAWNLFGRWAASGANAVDCVSFAIMHRFGIRKAFTFDAHFLAPGFDTLVRDRGTR